MDAHLFVLFVRSPQMWYFCDWSQMMFTKEQKKMLRDAVQDKIKSMKRMGNSRPEFSEVAKTHEKAYEEILTLVEKVDETPSGAKK